MSEIREEAHGGVRTGGSAGAAAATAAGGGESETKRRTAEAGDVIADAVCDSEKKSLEADDGVAVADVDGATADAARDSGKPPLEAETSAATANAATAGAESSGGTATPAATASRIQSTGGAPSPLASAASAEVVIHMADVKKTYVMGEETVHALRGISFTVRQGEFVSIMGPSGSGKSTCMNMIGCLDRPTSGIVEIGGKPTAAMSEKELAVLRNKTVGFVFQQYHLLPAMTVLENVMIPLRYQGVERALRKDMAAAALERVGLANRMRHLPAELSGGQKQRVAIARATVTRPQIILADEPTGALDSSTGRAVLELFGEINAAGTTIVIVTHDPKIGASTKRCIRILDGLIQSDGAQETAGGSRQQIGT